jgi:hypothetical protein
MEAAKKQPLGQRQKSEMEMAKEQGHSINCSSNQSRVLKDFLVRVKNQYFLMNHHW